MSQKAIYILEVTVTSKDKKRNSYFRKGYENGSRAFDFIQKYVNSNPAKWEYIFGDTFSDTIHIEGNGLFYIGSDNNDREEGFTTIELSKLNLTMDEPELKSTRNPIEPFIPDQSADCVWNMARTEKVCSACEHRLTCKEYSDTLTKKAKSGELGSFAKKLVEGVESITKHWNNIL